MDPITMLVAATLMAAGTHQQAQARKKIQSRQSEVTAQEMFRQRQLDEERNARMAATQPQFDRSAQEAEQQSIADKLAASYVQPNLPTADRGEYVAASGQPQEIADRTAAAQAGALKKGQDYAARLANLSSFRLLNFNNAVKMNRLGEDVGRINTAALRSSEILPMELEHAKTFGDGAALRGDLFNAAGSIAGMYAMAAPGAAAGAEAAGGGSGLTVPEGMWDRTFSKAPGLDPSKAGVGLKAPDIPRLTY